MRSEFNNIGKEFQSSEEMHQPTNYEAIVPMEFSMPTGEFTECAPEFIDMIQPIDDHSDEAVKKNEERKKKAKKKNAGEKLVRKMSYMVVSAVTVLVLAGTLDVTDIIQKNVLSAGGSLEGDLRFSIQWNDKKNNPNDFDAHCVEPGGYHISYGNAGTISPSGGVLDVDITHPDMEVAVENIVYSDKKEMEEGTYRLYVHNFSHNGGKKGFRAEVEINGRIYEFEYDKELAHGEIVDVAEVTWKNGKFTIDKKLNK